MDLRVLNGKDPAGYEAEKLLKGIEDAVITRDKKHQIITNPDGSQTEVYLRSKRTDLDRLKEASEREAIALEEAEFQKKRQQIEEALKKKTLRNKKKREQKKARSSKVKV